MHTLDHDAHILGDGSFHHGPDAHTHAACLLFVGADEPGLAIGVAGRPRRPMHGCCLEARAVESRQDGWREHHSHHLANGVRGVESVDPQQGSQLESQGRFSRAARARDVDDQGSGKLVNPSNGAIPQRGARAFGALEQISDLPRQIAAGQSSRAHGAELGLELGDQ